MPLYEYKCHSCGAVFEVKQKVTDDPLDVHADCGGQVERLISAPALQFKGSGWYITDYARKSQGKPADKGSKESTESAASKDSKADTAASKPAKSDKTDK